MVNVPQLFGAQPSPSPGVAQGFSDLTRAAMLSSQQAGNVLGPMRAAVQDAASQYLAFKAREKLLSRQLDAMERQKELDRQMEKERQDRYFGVKQRELSMAEEGLELERGRLEETQAAGSFARSQAARAQAQKESEMLGSQLLPQLLFGGQPPGGVGPTEQPDIWSYGMTEPSPYFPGLPGVPYAEPNLQAIQQRLGGALGPQQPPGGVGPMPPQPYIGIEQLGGALKAMEAMRPGMSREEAMRAAAGQQYPASPIISAGARATTDQMEAQQALEAALESAAIPRRASSNMISALDLHWPGDAPQGLKAILQGPAAALFSYDPESMQMRVQGGQDPELARQLQAVIDNLSIERPAVFQSMVGDLGTEGIRSPTEARTMGGLLLAAGPSRTSPAEGTPSSPPPAAEPEVPVQAPPTEQPPAQPPSQVPESVQLFRDMDLGFYGVSPEGAAGRAPARPAEARRQPIPETQPTIREAARAEAARAAPVQYRLENAVVRPWMRERPPPDRTPKGPPPKIERQAPKRAEAPPRVDAVETMKLAARDFTYRMSEKDSQREQQLRGDIAYTKRQLAASENADYRSMLERHLATQRSQLRALLEKYGKL